MSLSESQSNFQFTDPKWHIAYIYSHTHKFQYISITYVALYISSVYWHSQNVLINKFKPVDIYLCTYVSMYIYY